MLDGLFSFLTKTGLLLGALLVFVLVFLYFFQNKMLYIPEAPHKFPSQNPAPYRAPNEQGLTDFEDVVIKTSDNETLHGWFIRTENSKDAITIIYFHENAGSNSNLDCSPYNCYLDIGTRLPFIKYYQQYIRCNVLLVAYRGYSYSTGIPTERGLQLDSEAILDHVFSRSDIDKSRIFIHGRSLGGAVAIYIASKKQHPVISASLIFFDYRDQIAGLILENTFLSIATMVDAIFPKLAPLKGLVLRNYWPSVDRIGEIEKPIYFIVSLKDEIVPAWHVLRLKDKAKKAQFTDIHQIPEGTHNGGWTLDISLYFQKISEFLQRVGAYNHHSAK